MGKSVHNDENGKNKMILLILGVATVLVALIGATFAYFTAVINNVNGDQSVVVTTATVQGVTYTASEPLVLLDAIPGDHAETTFSISNPNASASAEYGLELVIDANNFENTEGDNQLVVTISGGQIVGSKTIDCTDSSTLAKEIEIVSDVTLGPSDTDEYTVRVDFYETQSIQNTNQTKDFAAHIEVTETIITSDGQ